MKQMISNHNNFFGGVERSHATSRLEQTELFVHF